MRAVDCQGFAGGFSLGVVQAGFELVGKREYPGGFGAPLMEGNRHLLGDGWKLQAEDPDMWEPVDAELVFGNPPCSGFSGLSVSVAQGNAHTHADWRGVDNPINNCIRALVDYGKACAAPTIIFESVQAAFKARPFLQGLHERLGQEYTLTHVLHNNLSLGGYAMRKRYFFVASVQPFGVERVYLDYVNTLRNAIGDLEGVPLGAKEGHVIINSMSTRRLAAIAKAVEWNAGEFSGAAWQRFKAAGLQLPEGITMTTRDAGGPGGSMHAPCRWYYDRPARVVHGMTLQEAVHPVLPRVFTHREVARIMGYPDNWMAKPAIERGGAGGKFWGKGIPVGSGRWIALWARRSLEGQPGSYRGELIGDREYLIDVTNDYKKAGA